MAKWKLPPNLHSEIVPGPMCFFHEHGIGSKDGNIPRYKDSYACVRCVSSLTEGRLSLDIHRIDRPRRRKFLEFWSLVDIRSPDECWEWQGAQRPRWSSGYFHIARFWTRCNTQAAQRVACWFTWGDIGRLPIRPVCQNCNCCNPLHMRIDGVPHFFRSRKLQLIELEFSSKKLVSQTQEFLDVSQQRTPGAFGKLERINPDWLAQRMADVFGLEDDQDDQEDAADSQPDDHGAKEEDLLS